MGERYDPPDFVIIGMPKAATTSLHETLEEHPGFCASTFKEPRYYADDIIEHAIESGAHGGTVRSPKITRDEYLSYFSHGKPGQIRFESSSNYIYSNVAAENIKKANPNAKALLIIREPRRWVTSYYQQNAQYGIENLPIEEAYEQSKTKTRTSYPWNRHRPAAYHYYDMAAPAAPIKKWKDVFGDDLMIARIRYVTKEWDRFYPELMRFLGAEALPLELEKSNASGRARFRFITQLLENIKPNEYQRVLGPLFKPISRAYRRFFFPPGKKPDWTPPKEDFVARVRQMERTTGIPLTRTWGYRESDTRSTRKRNRITHEQEFQSRSSRED